MKFIKNETDFKLRLIKNGYKHTQVLTFAAVCLLISGLGFLIDFFHLNDSSSNSLKTVTDVLYSFFILALVNLYLYGKYSSYFKKLKNPEAYFERVFEKKTSVFWYYYKYQQAFWKTIPWLYLMTSDGIEHEVILKNSDEEKVATEVLQKIFPNAFVGKSKENGLAFSNHIMTQQPNHTQF